MSRILEVVTCGCGYQLANIHEGGEICIRIKDQFIYTKIGIGGYLKFVCRGCVAIVILTLDKKDAHALADASGPSASAAIVRPWKPRSFDRPNTQRPSRI